MPNASPGNQPYELPADRRRAESLWLAEASSFCERIGVPENFEEVVAELRGAKAFRRLFGEWERLASPRLRRRRWEELCRATERAAYATRPFCLRCGECCRRQTPALHLPDLPLLLEGVIPRGRLLTLRRGERAYSALRDQVIVLTYEMVKVRQPESGTCPFFEEESRACRIYERRPLECQALKCWEPESFERATRAPRLKRRDILEDGPLMDLVARQEREVDCALALKLLEGKGSGARATVAQMVERDKRLREQALGQGVSEDELDFLLGRPLSDSVSDLLLG